MYGLVNKAVEQMVCAHHGEATWEAIKQRAQIDTEVFQSLRQYPDATTYGLVGAASETLGAAPEDILRTFGHYWMLYTAREGYGELLHLTGSSLREFLYNLPNLHARISLSFPDLRPPEFACAIQDDQTLILHYYSARPGLAPMVVGLLEGLSERFQTPIDIELMQSRDAGSDHEVFKIVFRA